MARVTLERVDKAYGNVVAVDDVSIDVKDQEFLVLVGPSGCGKSTILRLIAGLEEITSGNIYIGDRLINDVAPKDRDIAMVFQSYALYPHMDVYDNLAFGLKLRKTPKDEIDRRVRVAAESLGITELLKRKPKQLSGGQRQRVAVGRAIVREPKVFLMDEPLSNLDAKLRVQTRAELIKLHQRLQTTFIYVTHDQVEAMTMGSRIAVMKDGVVQQLDTPQRIYEQPANVFVAQFIGSPAMNLLEVQVTGSSSDVYLDGDSFRLRVPEQKARILSKYLGSKLVFGIRPEHVDSRVNGHPREGRVIQARIEVMETLGSEVVLYLQSGKMEFVARCEYDPDFRPGREIEVALNMDRLHLFDAQTGQTLRAA